VEADGVTDVCPPVVVELEPSPATGTAFDKLVVDFVAEELWEDDVVGTTNEGLVLLSVEVVPRLEVGTSFDEAVVLCVDEICNVLVVLGVTEDDELLLGVIADSRVKAVLVLEVRGFVSEVCEVVT